MTKLKIAMIICGSVLVLATGAQAYDLRIGNGSTTVTINPSSDGMATSATSRSRSQYSAGDHHFGAANGAR
jgi:hypothetical protein